MRSVLESQALAKFAQDVVTAANTDTDIIIAADVEQYFVVDWICWSYDIAPVGGYLQVQFGGVTVLELDITAAGPGMLIFDLPLHANNATKNEALVVTLGAAGAGCTGKLNIRYR